MIFLGRDLYSKIHPLEWSENIRNASHVDPRLSDAKYWELYPYVAEGMPCVLEQKAGDVLYIPAHWSHQVALTLSNTFALSNRSFQVLNLAETVGFASEIVV